MWRTIGSSVVSSVGRTNQPSRSSVCAAGDDRHAARLARLGDRGGVLVERALLDHGAHEVREVETSPTLSELIVSTSSSFIASHTLCATYTRDAAEHFWPWYSKPPRTIAVASACGSARRVREDEVLAAGLADEPRVAACTRRCSRRRASTSCGTRRSSR